MDLTYASTQDKLSYHFPAHVGNHDTSYEFKDHPRLTRVRFRQRSWPVDVKGEIDWSSRV
jgi:hypothetical protein